MTQETITIRSQELSPHGMRVIFRIEGTLEDLQGVKDWALETWGSRNCQGFSKMRQLNPKRARSPKIFLYSRPENIPNPFLPTSARTRYGRVYIPPSTTTSSPSERFRMKVAIFGQNNASLFKLRWK